MKVAGYLDGLEEDHEKYLTHFMNENEQLDKKAFTLIDRLIQIQQFDEEIQNDIVHAFKTINLDVLETSKEQLEAVYVRNDLELEKKQKLIEALESVQKKYSPKLGTYISQSKNVIPIPLIRSLYDGKGLIANEAIEEYIHYPFLSRKQPDFALRIKDNSMSKAGIEIDDIVFLRKTKWAEYNGQIVGVIINGQDGMLKRMKWTEGSPKIQLVSGNDSINPLEVFPNEIIMCGVYDGHFKMDKMR
ncbi:hypothetical protein PL1_3343 [Paenibacillus larvae subsp. larvae B-3650]|nr:hypothetical protein PL1_3343 [Paenibacillus larvae subsp. larvae B-3650]